MKTTNLLNVLILSLLTSTSVTFSMYQEESSRRREAQEENQFFLTERARLQRAINATTHNEHGANAYFNKLKEDKKDQDARAANSPTSKKKQTKEVIQPVVVGSAAYAAFKNAENKS